jgi:hypothetical protein
MLECAVDSVNCAALCRNKVHGALDLMEEVDHLDVAAELDVVRSNSCLVVLAFFVYYLSFWLLFMKV